VCGIDWFGFGGEFVCCVWERLRRVWLSEFVLCVGEISAFWGSEFFSVCGREWCGFGGVILCCVWYSLFRVWGSFCCVCESLVWALESEFVLCVGEYGVGLEE